MEEKEKTTQPMGEKVKEETEKLINRILEEGIKMENIDFLYKMIDIHKDIANEDYWDVKKEGIKMKYRTGYSGESYGRDEYGRGSYGKYEDNRYGNYGNYGRRMRDSRGRYMGGYNEYHNDDTMRTLMSSYQAYSDSKEAYGEGNYGAKGETITNLDYMLQSVVEFMQMLKNDVNSQEEMDLIKHYSKQISEM